MELSRSIGSMIRVNITSVVSLEMSTGFKGMLNALIFPYDENQRRMVVAIKAIRDEYCTDLRTAKAIAEGLTKEQLQS